MSRFHCRCRRCRARKVLRRHPDDYIRQPQCRVCGARDFRVDQWRMKRDTHAEACTCGGYWFWHRRGSKFCYYRKDWTERLPGDADFIDRHMEN